MGLLQATEVLKLLLGKGQSPLGQLLLYDALDLHFDKMTVPPDPDCRLCGSAPSITRWEEAGQVPILGGEPLTPPSEFEDEIDPEWLVDQLQNSKRHLRLVDVREPFEWGICHLPGAELIPLSTLNETTLGTEEGELIVFYCHKGVRSLRAVTQCREWKQATLKSLRGGIDAWAAQVDSKMPRY